MGGRCIFVDGRAFYAEEMIPSTSNRLATYCQQHLHNMATIRFLFLSLLLFTLGTSQAQSVLVSDPIQIRNDYGYEIIGRLKDRVLVFRDRYDNFEIQAFDQQLRTAWSKELEDLNRQGTRVLSVIPGKNDFSILFSQRIRGKHFLRIHKYDPAAVLIDTATLKIYGERTFSPPLLETSLSEDRNCVAVYNLGERDKIEVVCFKIDQMKLLWDKTALYEQTITDRSLAGLTLNNQGTFFITTEYDNKKPKIDQHRWHILKIGADQEEVIKLSLAGFLTNDVKFAYDHANQCLTAAGLWGEKTRERANGTFLMRAFREDQSAAIFQRTSFDDQLISVLRSKDVAGDSKGIENADVAQLLLREDGGAVMVVERHYEIQRGAGNPSRIMRDVRLVTDYYYEDVFIVSLDLEGKVDWSSVLHKKQYSQDDEAIFSSYFLMRSPKQLHFLFNDEIRYENTCSEYIVLPNGTFDRNSLLSTVNKGLRIRFRDGIQMSANECLIPSENRSKLRLISIQWPKS